MPLTSPIKFLIAASCGSLASRKRAASDNSEQSRVMLTESLARGVRASKSGSINFPSGSAPSAIEHNNIPTIATAHDFMADSIGTSYAPDLSSLPEGGGL